MIESTALDTIKGWFFISDREAFDWLLDWQTEHSIRGDLVELGCYLGKSAVEVGSHLHDGETFTVLDLFEGTALDEANVVEMSNSYASLTRAHFEQNYLRFHNALPKVVQGLSSEITNHVEPGSVRFMHIDASHLYEHVRGDVEAARELVRPDGVVVFDDYRSEHTPGVSAAVWEAVITDGLVPLLVTPSKLYGAWHPQPELQDDLAEWVVRQRGRAWFEFQDVAGYRVMRMKVLRPATARDVSLPDSVVGADGSDALSEAEVRAHAAPQGAISVGGPSANRESTPVPNAVSDTRAAAASQSQDTFAARLPAWAGPSRLRSLAHDLTPPILARRLHRLRTRVATRRP